jgi:hypothetical protein
VRPALATRLAADHPGLVPSLHAADSGSPPGD